LLTDQKSVLESLLEMALEERQIIINGESSMLEDVVRRELRELSKLGALEKKRATLNREITEELRLHDQELTVTVIAERAEPDEREVIVELQKELTALISKHTALNMENRELVKAHMEYSETMLDIMVGVEDPLNNFYGGDGKAALEKRKTMGLFDGHA